MLSTDVVHSNPKKSLTGIDGLDDITGGGLPKGRSTLLCGGTGTGKTLFGLEFLVHGAVSYGENGVFLTFEEEIPDLCSNTANFGFNIERLMQEKKIELDHVQLVRNQINGVYDLDGLFIRLDLAIEKVGAKRLVLDAIDVLFASLPNPSLIREEIRRLIDWIKMRGLTVIITAGSSTTNLTRDGIEEFVADCVIALENRVIKHSTTRFLRVIKYRGSAHGSNEYPFLVGDNGISVLPVTALALDLPTSIESMPTGIARLDAMLGGKGYYRGSNILVSGPIGSGKSSLAIEFAQETCLSGKRCLYFSLEEPRNQIIRNMHSIGIDLQPLIDNGLLHFEMSRPTLYGLEMHLAKFNEAVNTFAPDVVIYDPITTLSAFEDTGALKSMLIRLLNFLKEKQITSLFVALFDESIKNDAPEFGVYSLIDTWIQLRDIESNGERNRLLVVRKSRGMAHSNQMREFKLTNHGIELIDVYVGSAGVLTGSARATQHAQEKLAAIAKNYDVQYSIKELERKRQLKDAQILALEAEFSQNEAMLSRITELDRQTMEQTRLNEEQMSVLRHGDVDAKPVQKHAEAKSTMAGDDGKPL